MNHLILAFLDLIIISFLRKYFIGMNKISKKRKIKYKIKSKSKEIRNQALLVMIQFHRKSYLILKIRY